MTFIPLTYGPPPCAQCGRPADPTFTVRQVPCGIAERILGLLTGQFKPVTVCSMECAYGVLESLMSDTSVSLRYPTGDNGEPE